MIWNTWISEFYSQHIPVSSTVHNNSNNEFTSFMCEDPKWLTNKFVSEVYRSRKIILGNLSLMYREPDDWELLPGK